MSDSYITGYKTEIVHGEEVVIKVYAPSDCIPKKADREKHAASEPPPPLSLRAKRKKAASLRFSSETTNSIEAISKKMDISTKDVELLLNDFKIRIRALLRPERKNSTCDKYEAFILLHEEKLSRRNVAQKLDVSRQYISKVTLEIGAARRQVINSFRT
ncbi:hypothetical protein KAI46_01320 [bacterium]|nr:hypothetical protein [bacterium]